MVAVEQKPRLSFSSGVVVPWDRPAMVPPHRPLGARRRYGGEHQWHARQPDEQWYHNDWMEDRPAKKRKRVGSTKYDNEKCDDGVEGKDTYKDEELSRWLAYRLRHKPDGLPIRKDGAMSIAAAAARLEVSESTIIRIVDSSSSGGIPRYERAEKRFRAVTHVSNGLFSEDLLAAPLEPFSPPE